MIFEFATATKITFGANALETYAGDFIKFGTHAMIVVGKTNTRAKPIIKILNKEAIDYTIFNVLGEPSLKVINTGIQEVKEQKCDFVLSIGGGSVIDAGKAIAIMATNGEDLYDFLEVVGRGKMLTSPGLPFVAIPTTAGTGSEVTKNAVVLIEDQKVKVSLRNPLMYPSWALVDPMLTYSMPKGITASTGLDALTQLIEPYVCNQPNKFVGPLCREGIELVAKSIRRVLLDNNDYEARNDMSLASLFSGIALANARLGAVHGFAAPIGGKFGAPHGMVCACLLPHVIKTNVKVMIDREPSNPSITRYEEISKLLLGRNNASINEGINWIKEINNIANIPNLSHYGVSQKDIPTLVDKASASSSMKGNPIKLDAIEMASILKNAL